MKAVLISIKPQWCDLIATLKKTIEVRKTKPNLEVPFKVYIYCTQDKYVEFVNHNNWRCNGKVIGEFVCKKISLIDAKNLHNYCQGCEAAFVDGLSNCDYSLEKIKEIGLSSYELSLYIGDKNGYEWHISDLAIYDKPKELSEFKKINRECWYANLGLAKRDCPECQNKDCFITRPPQSWCYVESSVTKC